MSDEWGPWKSSGNPGNGNWIQVKIASPSTGECRVEGIVVDADEYGFDISPCPRIPNPVILMWRIRKPKGLAILQEIIREVERTDEMV